MQQMINVDESKVQACRHSARTAVGKAGWDIVRCSFRVQQQQIVAWGYNSWLPMFIATNVHRLAYWCSCVTVSVTATADMKNTMSYEYVQLYLLLMNGRSSVRCRSWLFDLVKVLFTHFVYDLSVMSIRSAVQKRGFIQTAI